MDEGEYHLMEIEEGVILRDLYNSSEDTKTEFKLIIVLSFIQDNF